MKGVILAAGIGSRLRPLTLHEPKCCLTVGNAPVLERQLRAYDEAGVTDVTVVAGYLADDARELCERVDDERPALDVTVVESAVYANTDNMYSLYVAREAVAGESFVLSNGDAVFDPGLLADLVAADAGSGVACDPATYPDEAMKVTVDDAGLVSHIAKDVPAEAAHAISNDVYRFSANFSSALFEEIHRTIEREGEYGEWTELAIDRVVRTRDHDLEPVDVGEYRWVEVDDRDDLAQADRQFSPLSTLAGKEAVFFDLDGTLYLDDDLVAGADRVVEGLRAAGTDVYFLSNNSSKWKDDYAARLSDLGVSAGPDDVLLSTDGVLDYLASDVGEAASDAEESRPESGEATTDGRDRADDGATAADGGTAETGCGETYVLGTAAMREALADHGIPVTDDPDLGSDAPENVVVGFDTELTYEKARKATLAIRDGATFLQAHPDDVCPTADGFVPDCGAIAAMVERATGRTPDRVFGKPDAAMVDHVVDAAGYDPSNVLVVGDRLETDVALAENVGCESVCVLTGDATRVEVERSEVDPTLVVPTVGALARFLDESASAEGPPGDEETPGADEDSSAEETPGAEETAPTSAVGGGDST